MTRSIFDPTGGEAERSGSVFTPPDADQISHLPQEFVNPPAVEERAFVDFVAPVEKPGIEVAAESDGKLLVITMTGTLHAKDFENFVPAVEAAVAKHGTVRMLVSLQNLRGWDMGAMWEDLKFDVKFFNHIERVAAVGDQAWEKWLTTIFKPFSRAKVRCFPVEQAAEAREWVMGD